MIFKYLVIVLLCYIAGMTMYTAYNVKALKPTQHDYQLDVDSSGYTVISNGVIIGRIGWEDSPQLDDIIQDDNK